MKFVIFAAALLFSASASAQGCRTSGPPGPDDCAHMSHEQELRNQQWELDRIRRQVEMEKARAKARAEIEAIKRQPNPPTSTPTSTQPSPAERRTTTNVPTPTTAEECRLYPTMCSAYRQR